MVKKTKQFKILKFLKVKQLKLSCLNLPLPKYSFIFLPIFLLLLAFSLKILFLVHAGQNLFLDILNNKPEKFAANFETWQKQTKYLPWFNKINHYLPILVGQPNNKTYLVLLQNNWELRPSGGFIGSYAKLKFTNAGLNEFKVQDIYVPDGQLIGHVDPPWPIQAAFQQGWWKLRDSNWEPDFPTASKQILWFFEKGGEEKADALIALNLLLIQDLVKLVEPLNLPDYNQQITSENLYQIAQQKAEKDFFPGSTQKKDFLSALNKQLILELKNINSIQAIQLIKLINKGLKEKQILINFNPDKAAEENINSHDFNIINQLLYQLNWNGAIKRQLQDQEKLISDYLYIIDTNLGANKANYYIQRETTQTIQFNKNTINEQLSLTYSNHSPAERPNQVDFWGGTYKNFLRLLLPMEAENIQIKINQKKLAGKTEVKNYPQQKVKSIGFFIEVPPLTKTTVTINYDKKFNPAKQKTKYILEIQKQPGINAYQHLIQIKPKNYQIKKKINTDEQIKVFFSPVDWLINF